MRSFTAARTAAQEQRFFHRLSAARGQYFGAASRMIFSPTNRHRGGESRGLYDIAAAGEDVRGRFRFHS